MKKMFCQRSQWPLQAPALLKGEMEPIAGACELFYWIVRGGPHYGMKPHKAGSTVM